MRNLLLSNLLWYIQSFLRLLDRKIIFKYIKQIAASEFLNNYMVNFLLKNYTVGMGAVNMVQNNAYVSSAKKFVNDTTFA